MSEMAVFARNVRRKRKERGISPARLSVISGVRRELILQLEREQVDYIPSEAVRKLSKAFGCTSAEMFREAR